MIKLKKKNFSNFKIKKAQEFQKQEISLKINFTYQYKNLLKDTDFMDSNKDMLCIRVYTR